MPGPTIAGPIAAAFACGASGMPVGPATEPVPIIEWPAPGTVGTVTVTGGPVAGGTAGAVAADAGVELAVEGFAALISDCQIASPKLDGAGIEGLQAAVGLGPNGSRHLGLPTTQPATSAATQGAAPCRRGSRRTVS